MAFGDEFIGQTGLAAQTGEAASDTLHDLGRFFQDKTIVLQACHQNFAHGDLPRAAQTGGYDDAPLRTNLQFDWRKFFCHGCDLRAI